MTHVDIYAASKDSGENMKTRRFQLTLSISLFEDRLAFKKTLTFEKVAILFIRKT